MLQREKRLIAKILSQWKCCARVIIHSNQSILWAKQLRVVLFSTSYPSHRPKWYQTFAFGTKWQWTNVEKSVSHHSTFAAFIFRFRLEPKNTTRKSYHIINHTPFKNNLCVLLLVVVVFFHSGTCIIQQIYIVLFPNYFLSSIFLCHAWYVQQECLSGYTKSYFWQKHIFFFHCRFLLSPFPFAVVSLSVFVWIWTMVLFVASWYTHSMCEYFLYVIKNKVFCKTDHQSYSH